MPQREMEVWQEIAKNAEHGAERLVAEYGDRLYAAATLLRRNNGDAEELVFRTLAQAVVVCAPEGRGIASFQKQSIRKESTVMTTKIIVMVVASIAVVVGMFFLGKCADKGNADTSSQHDKA